MHTMYFSSRAFAQRLAHSLTMNQPSTSGQAEPGADNVPQPRTGFHRKMPQSCSAAESASDQVKTTMEPSGASTNLRAAHQSGCFSTSCFLTLVSQHPLHFPKDQDRSLHANAGCNNTIPDLFYCLLYVCSLQDCKEAFIGNPA